MLRKHIFLCGSTICKSVQNIRQLNIMQNEMEMFKKRLVAEDVCREFNLTTDQLTDVFRRMTTSINLGLFEKTREKSTVKCWNTYIDTMPTGREIGTFLIIELGSLENRNILLTLSENNQTGLYQRVLNKHSSSYSVESYLKTAPGSHLFDDAAERMANFAKRLDVYDAGLPLILTFSFPTEHIALDSATLVEWTKGFKCPDVVGKDVVAIMRDSLRRTGIVTDVVGVLNNSTGTLMSSLVDEPATRMAVIISNGSNCCYVEKSINIDSFQGTSNSENCLINTEWGALGENGSLNDILTKYDIHLNKHSVRPGKQIFEKMVSGMYMGELVRLVILKMAKEKALFNGNINRFMETPYKLKFEHLSMAESNRSGIFHGARDVLVDILGVINPSEIDCALFRYACECVTVRSAHLVAAGVASLLQRLKRTERTVIAVDGNVFRKHHKYSQIMGRKAKQLTEGLFPFDLRLPEHGSVLGAAIVAANLPLNKKTNRIT